ncbi:CLUMA_CG003751, isoform A [Clunio marinus]|uniref:CLUMA_CG003751, isoform A n=1 Tax=Clunio marinus TaxID=568069 RepID=A0A1J1HR61_9DIPT|nr:CLUMA_CG003751, isoform A [Clunio marinus]
MFRKNENGRHYDYESLDSDNSKKLTIFFATLCVIDLFGVFPIVTLPKALISCGYYALPLILLVFSLQTYTAVVLGRCWMIAEKLDPSIMNKSRYAYAAIGEMTFGQPMKHFVTILLDLTVFGAGIPNLLVASQNLQLLGLRITNGSFDFSFCYFLIIIGLFLCPIMWLGSPKNMRILASISVTICTTVAILTWICIFKESEEKAVTPIEVFDPSNPPLLNLLKAYGIISFQFDIHPMLLTIQVDMQDKNKIGKAVFSGLMTTCTLSIITTLLVHWTYGQEITANVLESLPRSWTLYLIIMLVTLQLCLSSAVGNSALFQHVEDAMNISSHFNFKRCIIRSIFVWLAVLLGELIPKFDLVMGVIGGTLTGPLVFILPPLFYTKMLKLEKRFDKRMFESSPLADFNDTESLLKSSLYGTINSPVRRIKGYNPKAAIKKAYYFLHSECVLSSLVISFGVAATLTSTFYNFLDIKSLDEFWSPCIQNISLSYELIPR